MAKQNSGHTPKWSGNGKLVANCPECPTVIHSLPQITAGRKGLRIK